MPACNHCTTVFIDRNERELECEAAFVRGIQNQISCIRRWKLSLNMWRYLALNRWLGGIQKRVQSNTERCYATVVLSNVGELTLKDNQCELAKQQPRVEFFEPVGPLRRGTPVTISAFYFERKLHLTFRYDSKTGCASRLSQVCQHFREHVAFNS